MEDKCIKNSYPDYKWIKTSVDKCETCFCYDKDKVSKEHFCSVWDKRPEECCSYRCTKQLGSVIEHIFKSF